MLYPYSMFGTIRGFAGEYLRKLSRRELFRAAEHYPSPGCSAALQRRRAPLPTFIVIGVRPLINCRGTFTIVGGSLILPEVRAAWMPHHDASFISTK